LIFTQQTIATLSKGKPETGIKLYLESALITDKLGLLAKEEFGPISYEFISQSFSLYEENAGDSKLQSRCVKAIIGTLIACRCLSKEDYEGLIMKTAQYAAKMLKKPDQCEMVALCSNLFYLIGEDVSSRLFDWRSCCCYAFG
jgi:vacuolar protein sorting-associated protein 35